METIGSCHFYLQVDPPPIPYEIAALHYGNVVSPGDWVWMCAVGYRISNGPGGPEDISDICRYKVNEIISYESGLAKIDAIEAFRDVRGKWWWRISVSHFLEKYI